MVEPIIAAERWVIDGSYERKLGDLVIRNADTIVWLDLPVRVWLPRLMRRTMRRIGGRVRLWNDNRESLRSVLFDWNGLLPYAIRSHFRRRKTWPTRLAPFNAVRLRTPEEVERWLATVPLSTEPFGRDQDGTF
jgi:hypothetical protein